MSIQSDPLILRFAKNKPDELANILGNANLNELSKLVAELPPEIAAVLSTRLPSWQLSNLVHQLTPEQISKLLNAAGTADAVALVSRLRESRYPEILAVSTKQEKLKLRKLFDFPTHSLASLVTPGFISVEARYTCEEFSRQLSQNEDTQPLPIFVVDEQGKYLGTLSLHAVLSVKNRNKGVAEVMSRTEALSGMTSAENALGSRLWTQHLELAVVDNQHRLLGVVDKALLQRVAGDTFSSEFSTERLFSELATDYLNACGKLLESVLGRKP